MRFSRKISRIKSSPENEVFFLRDAGIIISNDLENKKQKFQILLASFSTLRTQSPGSPIRMCEFGTNDCDYLIPTQSQLPESVITFFMVQDQMLSLQILNTRILKTVSCGHRR